MKKILQNKIYASSEFTPQNFQKKISGGFTIIEVMIAMTIFTVLVVVGIGAVLDATTEHYRTDNMRVAMDNMNFIMEDIARNIRLGSNIHCVPVSVADPYQITDPESCDSGSNVVTFKSLDGSQLVYEITSPNDPVQPNQIRKSSDAGLTWQYLTPTDSTVAGSGQIKIDFDKSGFTVRGAEPNDGLQPYVIIRLAGTVTYKGIPSNFSIQTTVEQRQLDS